MTALTSYFFLFWSLSLLWFHQDLGELLALSWNDNRYTHIALIPFITAALIYLKRKKVFRHIPRARWMGLPLLALGGTLWFVTRGWPGYLDHDFELGLAATAIIITWVAAFILFYGTRTARAALFPLSLLVLAIPIPTGIVQVVEVNLQMGSAETAAMLYRLLAVPVFREGTIFSLPGVTIQVARECSGIRSSTSLLITALVLSHLFLRSHWRRALCVGLSVPIAIFKNAVRIVILSCLGAYVSPDYLTGPLHHEGGPLFSILSLAILSSALWTLRRNEEGKAKICASPELVPPLLKGN
jgi:exosortase